MEAERYVKGPGWHSYKELPWGELIYGTKEQLQRLGLGVGQPFPGQPGAPKSKLSTIDVRGFQSTIEARAGGLFSVAIRLPGRQAFHDVKDALWFDHAPGVQRYRRLSWGDEFVGTAEALVRAGLVPAGHFPGMPGMRRTRVRIFADGTLPIGSPQAVDPRARAAGAKSVERASGGRYSVLVYASDHEEKLRWSELRALEEAHNARMMALPTPAPLRPLTAAEAAMLLDSDPKDLSGAAEVLARFRVPISRKALR